jgi:hypothetical protein
MWMVIQDVFDPQVQIIGFGKRDYEDGKDKEKMIRTHLPQDFGKSGYGKRRKAEISNHLSTYFNKDDHDILFLYNYWLNFSKNLRQYL